VVGDPWNIESDVGPIISANAAAEIEAYCQRAKLSGNLIHRTAISDDLNASFVAPTLLWSNGIGEIEREVFGPVPHIATFESHEIDQVLDDINGRGFGLTFGLHSRINARVQKVTERLNVGNIYINRNQIGAVVGSQPFGGEGLSGTGPKAGGPNYLNRFTVNPKSVDDTAELSVNEAILPGPTGELNTLMISPRSPIICAGPGLDLAENQQAVVERLGGLAKLYEGSCLSADANDLAKCGGVIWWGDDKEGRRIALALANLDGAIIPMITDLPDVANICHERHLCVDTTAAGGNASLLGEAF